MAERLDGLRITPAYAGSTSQLVMIIVAWGDHPRIRGEHKFKGIIASYILGSPPHTRGALNSFSHFVIFRGITPAYAGSTSAM